MIWKMMVEGMPWFRFEWHPENRTAYMVRLPDEVATVIADDVWTREQSQNIVNGFVAGYREGRNEPELYKGNGPRTYHLKAETITIKGS